MTGFWSAFSFNCREDAGGAPYALLAGFPPQPLKDMTATIEQAQLKGAAITQKLV